MRVVDCVADETISSGLSKDDAKELAHRKGGRAKGYVIAEDIEETEKQISQEHIYIAKPGELF